MRYIGTFMGRALAMAACMTLLVGTARADSDELVYAEPSRTWMGSLPLGNGRIGAMVYGGTGVETVALSEVTMWSGQPDPLVNELCGPEKLREIREALLSGDIARGNDLGTRYLSGHDRSFGTNLPLGDLRIKFAGRTDAALYSRVLDMERAVADVTYSSGGVEYRNEYFCSNPAQILVARYTASRKGSVSASISLSLLRHATVRAEGNRLVADGDARFDKFGPGGVKFRTIVEVVADGGTVRARGDSIVVSGADALTLVTDIRTDYKCPDYATLCGHTVSEASAMSYKRLLRDHERDFAPLYNRMELELGGGTDGGTTDAMFMLAKHGEANAAFDETFFNYGRYMLISSSRHNSPLPAHLQGIWNDNLACNMPWTCDYHLDINIQQNYWSANIANMPECNEPLFRFLDHLSKAGHETARKVYGCNGWVAHTVNNIWGDTAPGGGVGWGLNVTAGAWMATQLWVHYDFTRDEHYLRTVGYPLIKATAEFFADYMVEDPRTGYLLSGPSISPENAFRMDDGNVYCISMMPTMDRAVIYDIYKACIEASRILDTDAEFRTRLERDIKRLPPYRTDRNGGLAEWYLDVVRHDPAHRHASHLVALYPFGEITPERTPELAEACRRFLDLQTKNGAWEDTEWTRGNMINFYARLQDGEEAYRSLLGLYTGFMRENLMTVSPAGVAGAEEDIFSFDATEAAVSGVCEMLLQSHEDELHFLPALPAQWPSGKVRGICARGGIEADFEWKDGRVTCLALRSTTAQTVKCRINGQVRNVTLKAGRTLKVKI